MGNRRGDLAPAWHSLGRCLSRLGRSFAVRIGLALLGGGTVVLEDSFDAADTLATIELERITHLFLVEPQLFELMDHPGLDRRNLRRADVRE